MLDFFYSCRLKELEVSIRSQVAAEERAHKIVEKLVLEDNISTDFLMHAVSKINVEPDLPDYKVRFSFHAKMQIMFFQHNFFRLLQGDISVCKNVSMTVPWFG